MARLNYLELPVGDVADHKRFYGAAFGWAFTDFGPDYAATQGQGTDIGLSGDQKETTAQMLPVIAVDDLEAALQAVVDAGGKVTAPIFAYPGGHRFHFRDPHGHELGVYKPDPA